MQATSIAFTKTQNNRQKAHLGSCEATANRDDRDASWHVNGHDNLQKIATEASAISTAFDSAIEKLKTQYKFYEGQEEDIQAVLSHYPFLIAELNKVYKLKHQYLGEVPMTLYYQNETFSLEDATLAVAAELDDDLWKKQFESGFYRFRKECWKTISKKAKSFITVIFE